MRERRAASKHPEHKCSCSSLTTEKTRDCPSNVSIKATVLPLRRSPNYWSSLSVSPSASSPIFFSSRARIPR
jgi:hypothetical protein